MAIKLKLVKIPTPLYIISQQATYLQIFQFLRMAQNKQPRQLKNS